MINKTFSRWFMGFGYNQDLTSIGERLDILNFYSKIRCMQTESMFDWIVFDASSYQIVNRTPQKKIKKLGDKPKAQDVLEVIITEQDLPKRQEIMKNCDLRSEYLQQSIMITCVNAEYIDARKVFRKDKDYCNALDESLDYVDRLKATNTDLISKIFPEHSTIASRLYLPLEIAEAIYLEKKEGVRCKFGPKKEEFFDESITMLYEEKSVPYLTVRCDFGPRRPGYLRDNNVIMTSSSFNDINFLLQSDLEYKNFVKDYLKPFMLVDESVEQTAYRMCMLLKID